MKVMIITPRNEEISRALESSPDTALISDHVSFLGNVPFQLWNIENLDTTQSTWHKDFGIYSNGLKLRAYGRIDQLGYAWFENP